MEGIAIMREDERAKVDFDKMLEREIEKLSIKYNVNFAEAKKVILDILHDWIIDSLNRDEDLQEVINYNLWRLDKLD